MKIFIQPTIILPSHTNKLIAKPKNKKIYISPSKSMKKKNSISNIILFIKPERDI